MPKRTRTIQEVEKELRAKQTELATLKAKRDKLARRLAAVDQQIGRLSGGAAPARRKKAQRKVTRRRRRGGTSLVSCIEQVLAGAKGGMRTKDVAEAVTKAGYKTRAKDFYNIVAKTLRDDRFKRVKRGVYTLAK